MKNDKSPENDEPLRDLLGCWEVDAALPPRFEEQVWQRIARAEAHPEPAFWGWLVHLVQVALPRPKVAGLYLASLLVLGIVAGSWTAQKHSNQLETALRLRYVQTIDPYQTAGLNP